MKADTSKSTMLIISMGLLVLYLAYSWKWAIHASLVLGVIGIISSYLSKKIEWVWMMIAKILGYIIPNVLLSLIYYLMLFPISAVSRLFTKDPLMLSRDFNTYFIDIGKEIDKNSLEKIW